MSSGLKNAAFPPSLAIPVKRKHIITKTHVGLATFLCVTKREQNCIYLESFIIRGLCQLTAEFVHISKTALENWMGAKPQLGYILHEF